MSKRHFVRAPRPEQYVRDSQGAVIRTELAPHSATQIGFDGKTLKANKNGLFEVTQDEHDRLVGQHGFESAGTADDDSGKPASEPATDPEASKQAETKKASRKPAKRTAKKAQNPAAEA